MEFVIGELIAAGIGGVIDVFNLKSETEVRRIWDAIET